MNYYQSDLFSEYEIPWILSIIGMLLVLINIFRKPQNKNPIQFFLGISLVLLPFLLIFGRLLTQRGYELDVVGKYISTTDSTKTLVINKAGDFNTNGISKQLPIGTGKWEISEGDLINLLLDYDNSESTIWIEVDMSRMPMRLIFNPKTGPDIILNKERKF